MQANPITVLAVSGVMFFIAFSGFLYFLNRLVKQYDEIVREFRECKEKNSERIATIETNVQWIKDK